MPDSERASSKLPYMRFFKKITPIFISNRTLELASRNFSFCALMGYGKNNILRFQNNRYYKHSLAVQFETEKVYDNIIRD